MILGGLSMSEFPIPTYNSHKPIYAIQDYNLNDGHYAPDSNTKHLSFGVSQWSDEDLSLKAFRHTGKQWSPQSEEIPPHRVIDLALLFCKVIQQRKTGDRIPCIIKFDSVEMNVELISEGNKFLNKLDTYWEQHCKFIVPRLHELSNLLDELKKEGVI
jgi:hypothetical protein